jgi:hypothetical protein
MGQCTDTVPTDSQLDGYVSPFWIGNGIPPGVEFECPTGNCTFDPFYSLSIDFQCQEMPNLLEFGCRNTSSEWLTTATDYEGPGTSPNVSSCGYYINLPGNPQLMSGYEVKMDGTVGEVLTTR